MRVPSEDEVPVYDAVMDTLTHAHDEPDALRKQNWLRVAQVLATSKLTDAIKECTATLKEVANRQIDSTQDLDRTLQTATNATVEELRRATIREVA